MLRLRPSSEARSSFSLRLVLQKSGKLTTMLLLTCAVRAFKQMQLDFSGHNLPFM